MDNVESQFEILDREDPLFHQKWASLLGIGLSNIDNVRVDETVEGGELLYKGALTLSLIEAALLHLTETEASTNTLFEIQRALSNARRGAKGPLVLSGIRRRARPPMSVEGAYKVACVATAVRILARFSETRKDAKQALRDVTAVFKTYGVRDTRGNRLNEERVEEWVLRSTKEESEEWRATQWYERNTPPPADREAALLEVRDLAREALAAQKLS